MPPAGPRCPPLGSLRPPPAAAARPPPAGRPLTARRPSSPPASGRPPFAVRRPAPCAGRQRPPAPCHQPPTAANRLTRARLPPPVPHRRNTVRLPSQARRPVDRSAARYRRRPAPTGAVGRHPPAAGRPPPPAGRKPATADRPPPAGCYGRREEGPPADGRKVRPPPPRLPAGRPDARHPPPGPAHPSSMALPATDASPCSRRRNKCPPPKLRTPPPCSVLGWPAGASFHSA